VWPITAICGWPIQLWLAVIGTALFSFSLMRFRKMLSQMG